MAILEKIASHILSFEKMSLIDKEKLKIAEETHYKLQKTKGKLHNITVYKNGGVLSRPFNFLGLKLGSIFET